MTKSSGKDLWHAGRSNSRVSEACEARRSQDCDAATTWERRGHRFGLELEQECVERIMRTRRCRFRDKGGNLHFGAIMVKEGLRILR